MSAEDRDTRSGEDDGGPTAGRDVMSSLPRTRPQRPSRRRAGGDGAASKARRTPSAKPTAERRAKRAAAPAKPAARATAKTPRVTSARRKPAGVRPSAATDAATSRPSPKRPPSPPSGTDLVGTAVQAAGELAELGLTFGARALRDAVKRIPRP